MRRRAGARGSPIGSAFTSARLLPLAACRRRWFATISRPVSPRPRVTSPASTAPTRTLPPITALRSCRRGSASRATRPRWKWPSKLSSASCWHDCATGASSDLNIAIHGCVADLNAKIMRKLGKSRRELLEMIERPALQALPTEPYRYAEWKRARVAPDYHVEIAGHFYSVPSRLIREVVEARITDTTIEIFYRGTRVACHAFSPVRNRHTTIPEHMPSAHRRYAEWTPARLMRKAEKIGPATLALFEAIMRAKPHPEQGFRA